MNNTYNLDKALLTNNDIFRNVTNFPNVVKQTV